MKHGPTFFPVSLLAFLAAAPVGAQDTGERGPLRCISLSSIDRTEVIDNQTIAFYLTGGRVYLNRLGRACRNLGRNRPFSYRTMTGQLCAIDTITVIEDFGASAMPGDTCGLGEFVPTDEEEIEVLKGEVEAVEVEPEEVEVEDEDQVEDQAETGAETGVEAPAGAGTGADL